MDGPLNEDQQLVQRVLAGEERAFDAFFGEYFPRLYRFALPRLSRDEDLAKDVVQATLIKALRGLAGFRGDSALFTWLCQICRREIVDQLRELRRIVHAVLDRLPARYGEALELKYIEERSVEEIGDRLGIGHTAAQSLLARARVAFRDGMEAVFGAAANDVLTRFGV